jgi:hypothetical protein
VVAAAPAPAAAETKSDDTLPAAIALATGGSTGGKRSSPFGIIAVLDQSLGLGTFVDDTYARQALYKWLLSLRPRYYFLDNLSLEARIDITQELTTSYTSGTTAKRQVMPSDTLLTLSWQNAATIPWVGLGFSPFARLYIPTSPESRYRNQYLGAALGFDLTRALGKHFFVDYTFRVSKYFNRTTTATVTGPVGISRLGGPEGLGGGEVATGDRNVEWSFLNSLMGSWLVNDQWSVSLTLWIVNSLTYDGPGKDALSGDFAKAGRGQRDKTRGILDVTYQPWEHFGFSAGIDSYQPAKTADNKRIRFPFFDFTSEGNNYTSFYLDVFATY